MAQTSKPYLLDDAALTANLETAVDSVVESLTSQFLLLPRGASFLSYREFRDGYEALRMATGGFQTLTTATCWDALRRDARAWIVLRTIMGISPPEWGDLANEVSASTDKIPNNWCRVVDGDAKQDPRCFTKPRGRTRKRLERIEACLSAAASVITAGASPDPADVIHRLDKFDTRDGLTSVQNAASLHVPYAVLLYERFLGRPFASHRDAVSELVGDVMETAIEDALSASSIPSRKTRRAERIPDFEQAPDFFVPDEVAPTVIIEAKVCGDEGTARDKVARVLRLAAMRDERIRKGNPSFQVIACIDGRGFSRRQDMRDLLLATHGKVFTLETLSDLISSTALKDYLPRG